MAKEVTCVECGFKAKLTEPVEDNWEDSVSMKHSIEGCGNSTALLLP